MSILDRLRMIGIFIGLVKDPTRTELIFKAVSIASKYKDDPVAKQVFGQIIDRPDFRKRYEEHYLPDWPTLEQLAAAPEGSFAQALHRHMVDNGLDLDLFPRFEPRDELDYLNARAYQDHDLWHALLGYGTGIEDELALQAFSVAQFGAPLGSLIISGGILHLMLRDPVRAASAVRKVSEGYKLGEKARFLLGMKLIDLLPRPLAEVRQLAGVA
jgi:ubiquinone biosynthesis protein COQ4